MQYVVKWRNSPRPTACTRTLKGRVRHITGHEGPEGEWRYSSALSLTSTVDGSGLLTPRPGRFTSGDKPVPVVWEVGRAPGWVWSSRTSKLYHMRAVFMLRPCLVSVFWGVGGGVRNVLSLF